MASAPTSPPDASTAFACDTHTATTGTPRSSFTASSIGRGTHGQVKEKSVRHRLSRVFSRMSLRSNVKHNSPHDSPQPGHPLPELPPELWILILEYSTWPPYPCSPPSSSSHDHDADALPSLELPSSFLSPALTPASLAPRLAYYRASMHHKRTLTLVSKKWHGYAQPVLYASIWISRSAQAKALALTLLCQACCLAPTSSPAHQTSAGRFIRRLHIETPALERCNAGDLRSILAYAPGLEVYSDFRSVRRGAPAEQLLGALAKGVGLKRLSWTSYDDPALVGLGLGLSLGLGSGVGVGVGHMGGRLEYLELNFVSTGSAFAPSACLPTPTTGVALPALRTLKVALDNATFAVLATWDLPALRNLSVLSADFSYAGEGLRVFFGVHGGRLRQLELGHSSALIEEFYLTGGPPPAPPVGAPAHAQNGNAGGAQRGTRGLNLAEWCPRLEEFVCSADAAWDWQHPDWIAPHLLLPAHPTVTLIGIRGIDARIWDDYARGVAHHSLGANNNNGNAQGDAFFGLRAQVESLLRREAFPRLRYVRDLSEGSDKMRRGRVSLRTPSRSSPRASSPHSSAVPHTSAAHRGWSATLGRGGERERERDKRERERDAQERERVVRFWEGVLGRCRDEGVWLEDWRGWNVTSGGLRRTRAALRGMWEEEE